MLMSAYQKSASRTMADDDSDLQAAVYAMGLAGEAGEVVDYLKKVLGHGHELDTKKLTDEIGDVLWYIAALASHYKLDLDNVAHFNLAKLERRYPQGFDHSASRNRRPAGMDCDHDKSFWDGSLNACAACRDGVVNR